MREAVLTVLTAGVSDQVLSCCSCQTADNTGRCQVEVKQALKAAVPLRTTRVSLQQ